MSHPRWYAIRTVVLMLVFAWVAGQVMDDVESLVTVLTEHGPDRSTLGRLLLGSQGSWMVLAIATVFFVIAQAVLFPFLSISDAILGRGRFPRDSEDVPRAAIIVGWCIVYAATLLAFALSASIA